MTITVIGTVVHGLQLGKKHGLPPTMNIQVESISGPLEQGIYAVVVSREDRLLQGVAHYGPRPAVNAPDSFEVHCFNFNEDWYGERVTIYIKKYIRPIANFDSIEGLKEQIEKDIRAAKAIHLQ